LATSTPARVLAQDAGQLGIKLRQAQPGHDRGSADLGRRLVLARRLIGACD